MKTIDHILEGRKKYIGQEYVLQPLPHKNFRFASPFIVLHHLPVEEFAPDSEPLRLPPHPHRGFAPVSFMFQGEGFHRDSAGHSGYIRGGEVQWMFAGKGLLHSEGPSEEFLKKGGSYEMVQLWVNVPASHKMDEPFYQHAKQDEMPLVLNEPGIELRVASGTLNGQSGPLKSFTPVISAFGEVISNKTFTLSAPEGYWTLLYVLEGSISVNDEQDVGSTHLVVFSKAGTDIHIHTHTDTKLLYLSALPLEEPVAAKGNFVMNTPEEITQAEIDFADGKFGELSS